MITLKRTPLMEALKAKIAEQNKQMNSIVGITKKIGAKTLDTRANYNKFAEQEELKAQEMAGSAGPVHQTKPVSFLEKLKQKKREQQENDLAAEAAESIEVQEDPSETQAVPYQDILQNSADSVKDQSLPDIKEFDAKGESFALNITLNTEQLAAKALAFQGKSFVLTGAAGTGKTTCQRAIAQALLQDNALSTCSFKTYNAAGAREYKTGPSIAFCAYTRRAARNLERAVHKLPELEEKLRHNIMTIHMLLEYEPETYWDDLEGKEVFRFVPRRTANNPLTITHLIVEESSMLGLDLWEKLYDALPAGVQIIFIGDINQLPPVFGPSIMNYALVQLPIVELKEVYRNQGIVLENAHHVLKGEDLEEDNNFVIVRGKDKVQHGQEIMSRKIGNLMNALADVTGDDGYPEYDPEDCIILSPFNKQALGTDNLNNWIAQFIGDKRKAVVHEILAGFHKHYLAKGDKVMFNKRDGVITDILSNPKYTGKVPQLPGSDLLRFGTRRLGEADVEEMNATLAEMENASKIGIDYENFSLEDEKLAKTRQASHEVVIRYEDGTEDTISSAGDFAPACFSLGYCLTYHKAQGSEWRKVFLILHKAHAIMCYRELFYTGLTRARTKVIILSNDAVIKKTIANPRIKGNTLADKLEFFNSGIDQTNIVEIVK